MLKAGHRQPLTAGASGPQAFWYILGTLRAATGCSTAGFRKTLLVMLLLSAHRAILEARMQDRVRSHRLLFMQRPLHATLSPRNTVRWLYQLYTLNKQLVCQTGSIEWDM